MSGGFYISDGNANYQALGQVTTTSSLTAVTAGAANTKGSYVQLSAATTYDMACWALFGPGAASTGKGAGFDVAIGASGSEKIIASNIGMGSGGVYGGITGRIPVPIPAGVRLAVRAQSTVAADATGVGIIAFDDGAIGRCGGSLDAIGFDTTQSTGTFVDSSATVNTKGSYTQIIAATTVDYAGFMFRCDSLGGAYTASSTALLDIAIGASGSEKIIVGNYWVRLITGGNVLPGWSGWIDQPIRTGSRIAVRSQCSTSTAANRVIGFTLYGLRG